MYIHVHTLAHLLGGLNSSMEPSGTLRKEPADKSTEYTRYLFIKQ